MKAYHLDHMSPCKECPQTAPKSAQKEQTSTAIDFGFENEQTIHGTIVYFCLYEWLIFVIGRLVGKLRQIRSVVGFHF